MNEYPVFCAYHIDVGVGKYTILADKLANRCDKLGIVNDISTPKNIHEFIGNRRKSVSLRNWICRFKPTFILNMLDKWDQPILYMDVDGYINKKPPIEVFDIKNIGINKQYGGLGGVAVLDASVAAIYFNNNNLVRKFLKHWHQDCKKLNLNKADHLSFKRSVVALRKEHPDIVEYFPEPLISLRDIDDVYIQHYRPSDHGKCNSNYSTE